jgi:endonuclease/exonuclease/phosphatase (EEP) superfamily protein YafD
MYNNLLPNILKDRILGGIILIITISGFVIVPNYYIFRQLESFGFQWLLVCSSILLFSLFRTNYKWVQLFSIIGILLTAERVLPALNLLKPVIVCDSLMTFDVEHHNVWEPNTQMAAVVHGVLERKPELVAFQEINGTWANFLIKHLQSDYPFYVSRPRENKYGMIVFSRDTIIDSIFPGMQVSGLVKHPSGFRFRFIASHIPSPMNSNKNVLRTRRLLELCEWAKADSFPVLLLGDYNSVPWIAEFDCFINAGFEFAHTSFVPTYPTFLGIGIIPIDLILSNKGLKCIDFEGIDCPGSDHYGIRAKMAICLSPKPS